MSHPAIATVVEGQGEADAIQGLLARVVPWLDGDTYVHCHVPNRKPRDLLLKPHGIAAALRETLTLRPNPTGILFMVDADDGCPVRLADDLRALAKTSRPDAPVFAVIPDQEFEAWFLASAPAFAGKFGLPDDLEVPADSESIRDAKGWFSKRMPQGRPYKPTQHQKLFVKHMDLGKVREHSRSFRKFCSDVETMISPSTSS